MSLNELDIISDENIRLKTEVEKLKNYIKSAKLQKGDKLQVDHASIFTGIEKNVLKKILEKGEMYNLFQKITYYECSKKKEIIGIMNDELTSPFEAFCDLCDEEHIFNAKDNIIKYKILFEIESYPNIKENENEKDIFVPIDFGVLTALTEELNAVLNVLQLIYKCTLGVRTYYFGKIESHSKSYNIVVVKLPNMGSNDSAAVTSDLINEWDPKYLIKIGIAAGYKDDVDLGDVVISNHVYIHDYTKEHDEKSVIRPVSYATNAKLFGAADNFDWDFNTDKKSSKSILGHIATGNQLIKSREKWERIKKINDKIIALEMEAGGMATVAFQQESPKGIMVISGISDFGDSTKNDDWHVFAAEAAAKYFCDLLKEGSI